ncbi:hypothetical protein DICVIV_11169 [Dictyocaulus viviparus]|uniref:Carboxylesterase type B domain-containing protein n=1 Tax=Dictyocaulus viviparus TaxID=29172 RepID=A0A0D8XE13_DICVI|nr:hypothetical protein DICVIV_11169 [Dictyocaulus viviparus]
MKQFMPYFEGSIGSKETLITKYKDLFRTRKTAGEKLRDGVGRFLGDLFFTCDLIDLADIFSRKSSKQVFLYHFNVREKLRDGVGRFLGDLFFTCDLIDLADIFSRKSSKQVFLYHFNVRSSANRWPKWMGVVHGYEIEYMFGQPIFNSSFYAKELINEEKKISDYLMKMWANSAKSG